MAGAALLKPMGLKRLSLLVLAAALLAAPAAAQSRLQTMPGYDQWAKMAPLIPGAVTSGAINAEWAADSKSFDYSFDATRWRFDVGTQQVSEATAPLGNARPAATPAPAGPVFARGRGREADVLSPDGSMRAISRDHNIWIVPAAGGPEKQITADGGAATRIRHGVGSYVYLEEFNVSQPVWWSPDGKSWRGCAMTRRWWRIISSSSTRPEHCRQF